LKIIELLFITWRKQSLI